MSKPVTTTNRPDSNPMSQKLAEARGTFPATQELVYLDAAAVSLISQPVYDAIQAFLDICIQPGSADASRHHMVMDEMRLRAIEEAAILLNAKTGRNRPGGKHHPRAEHRGQRHSLSKQETGFSSLTRNTSRWPSPGR